MANFVYDVRKCQVNALKLIFGILSRRAKRSRTKQNEENKKNPKHYIEPNGVELKHNFHKWKHTNQPLMAALKAFTNTPPKHPIRSAAHSRTHCKHSSLHVRPCSPPSPTSAHYQQTLSYSIYARATLPTHTCTYTMHAQAH